MDSVGGGFGGVYRGVYSTMGMGSLCIREGGKKTLRLQKKKPSRCKKNLWVAKKTWAMPWEFLSCKKNLSESGRLQERTRLNCHPKKVANKNLGQDVAKKNLKIAKKNRAPATELAAQTFAEKQAEEDFHQQLEALL